MLHLTIEEHDDHDDREYDVKSFTLHVVPWMLHLNAYLEEALVDEALGDDPIADEALGDDALVDEVLTDDVLADDA
jgi:hypothetical protein